ncbi:MAG TPA: hypothetical protein VLV54_00265 [Thermoanaerobaculia bacterium]|nr:hypothetical protein [Thermoanaerobaculia bacterium]
MMAAWKLRWRRWALMRALARAHLPEKELRARIDMLDPLVNLPENSGSASVWPALVTVVALSQDRFGMALDAVVDLSRFRIDPRPLARWTAAGCGQIGDELFGRVLELAVRIAGMRLDPQPLLGPLLELSRPQSLTPDFLAILETLEQVAGTPRPPNAAALLKSFTRAVSGPLGRHRQAILDLTQRMLASGMDLIEILDGLAALAALDEPRFAAAADFVARMGEDGLNPGPLLRQGFLAAASALDWQGYLDALHVFELLLDRIRKAGGRPDTAPGLAELTRQALSYARDYSDFTVVLHSAVTHEESYDSYGMSYSTVVDEPARLELRPAGERRTAVSLVFRGSAEIESWLTKRSWLWKNLAGPEERKRVIARGAAVREKLGTIVDDLMRSHILVPEQRILAIYLIGSYAWSQHPNDLDLFVVLEGRQDVARFDRTRSRALDIEVHGSVVPLDVEVVGWDTLLDAVRGAKVRHADVLAQRYGLLYGSVLLAGQDIHESVKLPRETLESLRTKLLTNAKDADWPELAGDPERIRRKREWRLQDAAALRRFLDASGE